MAALPKIAVPKFKLKLPSNGKGGNKKTTFS